MRLKGCLTRGVPLSTVSSNALLRQKTTELEDSKQALEQELVVLRDALRNIEELNESHIRDKEEITIAVKAVGFSDSYFASRISLVAAYGHLFCFSIQSDSVVLIVFIALD